MKNNNLTFYLATLQKLFYLCSMSVEILNKLLPENALLFIKKWLGNHQCHIKITRSRQSKLGDYRLMPDKSHLISINGNLESELFFFVFTHEIAHLLAFHEERCITAHGKEWKNHFRKLLLESILVYSDDLQPLIISFAKNPKANFMSSPELVKYFDKKDSENQIYVEELFIGEEFIYENRRYKVEEKKKKRYLCKNLYTGRMYLFKSCAKVEKL